MKTSKQHRGLKPLHWLVLLVFTGLVGCDSGGGSNGGNNSSNSSSTATASSSSSSDSSSASSDSEPELRGFEVWLEGEQSVPMVQTDQSAMASVTINETDGLVTAEMDLNDVSGVNAAHIHTGEVGSNGPVTFGFSDADEDGVWKIEGEAVTQAQYEALIAGQWYVNVHTERYPDGEIRGQILTDTQTVHAFTLSGEQEVPPVETDGYGQGYLLYDSSNGMLTLNTWVWNLTATAAHIHLAEAGLNGDIVAGWEVSPDDEGVWQVPEETILGSDEVLALYMANLYVNIHTEANPDGEIRGQILPEGYELLLFDLSPGQEVPRVESSASGAGYATINTETGGLRLNAWSMNMQATAAHIHEAGIGENGDVAIGLEENTEQVGLWQIPVNTGMEAETQALLLSGGHYLNMHSDEYPDGEIRGQIVSGPWDVLTFALSGAQEVPPVETEAEGDGYALLNTELGDLTMVVNTRNLDTASAAHIHTGAAGVNGDILLGLEQDGIDASVWRLPGDISLDEPTLAELMEAGHYVNVHSPSHPDGEIRGQITY
ncbi:CHRD domain-containing protein [Marinimicrobium sp. C2-29]|uniref:CHRD domain-containing protein n=1 Tax=Marinimicrobium sp. C2-29 TaxID=3139825 RepID=UPI003138B9A8